MEYRLGKRPARKGAIRFQFEDYFDNDALPTPPLRFGHERIGKPWGMFANDKHMNCVFAGAAHEHMVWTHEGGGPTCGFRDEDVLADYAAVTGFNPKDPDSDVGTDMSEAARYRRTVGMLDDKGVRRKVDSYCALRPGRIDDLLVATYLTGATGVGLIMPDTAMDQFDAGKPWTVVQNAKKEGGHYVTCIGRNSQGLLLVVTWGRIHAMTPDFYDRYSDEAVSFLSLEILRGRVTPEGFDESELRLHLRSLGHKPGG